MDFFSTVKFQDQTYNFTFDYIRDGTEYFVNIYYPHEYIEHSNCITFKSAVNIEQKEDESLVYIGMERN